MFVCVCIKLCIPMFTCASTELNAIKQMQAEIRIIENHIYKIVIISFMKIIVQYKIYKNS